MEPRNELAVVIAEAGSDWSHWEQRWRSQGHRVDVLVQRPGEDVSGLTARLRSRLHMWHERGISPQEAALVGGERDDTSALSFRSSVLRVLSRTMIGRGGGSLYLDSGSQGGPARRAMAALASAVSDQVRRTGLSVVHATGLAGLELDSAAV